MFNDFIALIILSMLFGAVISFLCSYLLKLLKEKGVILHRVQEITIIVIFGFLVYTFAEKIELSPILALQTCGICMAQYTFYNISFQAREESCIITKVLTLFAEGFIFVYLGLTSIPYFMDAVSWSFIFWQILILMICRSCSIFGVSFIME